MAEANGRGSDDVPLEDKISGMLQLFSRDLDIRIENKIKALLQDKQMLSEEELFWSVGEGSQSRKAGTWRVASRPQLARRISRRSWGRGMNTQRSAGCAARPSETRNPGRC
ncbi:hypothetical protein NDU88_002897 [Pleurodeles waltl]|uniref:Uncharacterized protein n=1 Tax=Pleurodeles waltl TaxID=8319 RepID=A0AAV7MQ40_PLEWA|nr:hypothetical protein NDU88_002897 [Pleurodeles waltl]